MLKISSRNILDILRQYEIADETNIPRHIESIEFSSPSANNTLVAFCFLKHKFYLLFDETADDEVEYITGQIKKTSNHIAGELVKNPKEASTTTFGMPFHGKECYLFEVISGKVRLDIELAKRYPDVSRNTWQKHIKAGFVSVNGTTVTSPKQDVTENDNIAVNLPIKPDYSQNELPIIYIDDNIVVINKPIGILSHAKGELSEEFTVADFFKRYSTYNLDTNRPGIVHRLDRDTSGIMIGARTPEAATVLQKQFADRKAKKTYLAIVKGHPKLDKANIDLPIARNFQAPSTFKIDASGKSAQTKYEVVDRNDKYSLTKLQPTTGRTHQLRVHMKYLNTPILGDRAYDKPSDRLYLHAYSLEITDPEGNRRTFTTPIPDAFTKIFPNIKL